MAEAAAALQAQINAAVVTALAAQAAVAVPAPLAHVAVKLPDFWVKDPKMWFSQAEAQFRRARITAETSMYDYILMKLPQDVVMSVRALVSAIEADPVKQEASYTLIKEALMGSFCKTKWQMAYALLDHPDLGDRRPSAMMAEMLALRFETTPPDSLFLALFLRRLPTSIRDHLAAANHETATAMSTHADVLWDARNSASVSMVSEALAAAVSRSPRQIAAVEVASRPAALHLDAQMAKRFAGSTGSGVRTLPAATNPVTGRETRSPPWAAQCSRRPHLSPGFGL
jgi:HEPN domain-containing protein